MVTREFPILQFVTQAETGTQETFYLIDAKIKLRTEETLEEGAEISISVW